MIPNRLHDLHAASTATVLVSEAIFTSDDNQGRLKFYDWPLILPQEVKHIWNNNRRVGGTLPNPQRHNCGQAVIVFIHSFSLANPLLLISHNPHPEIYRGCGHQYHPARFHKLDGSHHDGRRCVKPHLIFSVLAHRKHQVVLPLTIVSTFKTRQSIPRYTFITGGY